VSWAASVLLCDRTRVGLSIASITFAIVKVLPLPVTPRSTWCFVPATSPRPASGSLRLVPLGWNSVVT